LQITNRFVQMFSIEFNGTGLGPDVAAAHADAAIDVVDWPGGAMLAGGLCRVIRSNRTGSRLEAPLFSGQCGP